MHDSLRVGSWTARASACHRCNGGENRRPSRLDEVLCDRSLSSARLASTYCIARVKNTGLSTFGTIHIIVQISGDPSATAKTTSSLASPELAGLLFQSQSRRQQL